MDGGLANAVFASSGARNATHKPDTRYNFRLDKGAPVPSFAKVAELVDALDLGSSGATRESSSLFFRTIVFEKKTNKHIIFIAILVLRFGPRAGFFCMRKGVRTCW